MAIRDLQAIIEICRKYSIESVSLGDIEIKFKREAEAFNLPVIPIPEIPGTNERMPTDDEMLLYSSGAFDEIREERAKAILAPSQGK